MGEDEWLRWIEFFKLHPFDDYSRFHRPAALVASSMGGAEVGDLLDWLEHKPLRTARFNEVDLSLMERFGHKPPRKD